MLDGNSDFLLSIKQIEKKMHQKIVFFSFNIFKRKLYEICSLKNNYPDDEQERHKL